MSLTFTTVDLSADEGYLDKDGVKGTRKYQVTFTGTYDAVGALIAAYDWNTANPSNELPVYGEYHPSTSNSYCSKVNTRLEAEAIPNPSLVTNYSAVSTLTYEADYEPIDEKGLDQTPLSRPAQISFGGSEIKETRRYDINNNPIVNSVGDFYADLPEFFVRGGEIQITRNEGSNPFSSVQTYSNSTNSGSLWGFAVGQLIMGKITAQKKVETYAGDPITFYTVTYPIQFNRNGWNFKPLNYGYRFKDSSGNIQANLDAGGVPKTCLLYADGTKIPDADIADMSASAVFYPTSGYVLVDSTDWSGLSLPDPTT